MGARRDAMIVTVQPTLALISMSIYEQVLTFIHRPEPESFERIALAVFRHQFETIAAYRRYCEGLGVEPDAVGSVDEIPAVSNVAFKYAELASEGSSIARCDGFSHQRDDARAGAARTAYCRAARDLSRVGDRSSAHDAVSRRAANGDARDASDGGRDAGVVAVGDDQLECRRVRDGRASGGSVARAGRCGGGDRVS